MLGLDAGRITAAKLGFEVVLALATVLSPWPRPHWSWRPCSTRCGGGSSTGWTRRFNRSRYDADLMTGAFAAPTDLDAAQADLAATVNQALAPSHVSLWLSR